MNETEELWCRCLAAFNIESATLFSQSVHDPFRRVYVLHEKIYKVVDRQRQTSIGDRQHDLAGEFDILRHCADIKGVPSATAYLKTEEFEAIVMERRPGKRFNSLKISLPRLILSLARLSVILFKLSLRGVSHNDIGPQNILVTSAGSVSLIDFDQATRAKFVTALIRQFLGISTRGVKVQGSLFTLIRRLLKKFRRKLSRFLRRSLRLSDGGQTQTLPVLPDDARPKLKALLKAWHTAQRSDASSLGKIRAYYSLDVKGYHFPGARPWVARWDVLGSITDYSGKRTLELGCNMALLSCYLLKESNTIAALAVDVDARILQAAEQVSLALGVKPVLRHVDFDSTNDWETQLADFQPEIVFALNVLNWVEQKDRFLSFLGRFPEVIFEGHDDVDVERTRLRAVGFQQFDIIGTSARGRQIILCRK